MISLTFSLLRAGGGRCGTHSGAYHWFGLRVSPAPFGQHGASSWCAYLRVMSSESPPEEIKIQRLIKDWEQFTFWAALTSTSVAGKFPGKSHATLLRNQLLRGSKTHHYFGNPPKDTDHFQLNGARYASNCNYSLKESYQGRLLSLWLLSKASSRTQVAKLKESPASSLIVDFDLRIRPLTWSAWLRSTFSSHYSPTKQRFFPPPLTLRHRFTGLWCPWSWPRWASQLAWKNT